MGHKTAGGSVQQEESDAAFDTTSWSVILRAPDSGPDLERLLAAYWTPVYAYIRRTGATADDAADLTQEFLTQIVLERGLPGKADPERGMFRAFLKASLRNFLVDQHRRDRARRLERRMRFVPDGSDRQIDPPDTADPSDAFDRQWAVAVLESALRRVQEDCTTGNLTQHWEAFSLHVIGPIMHKAEPLSMEALAARIGADSPEQASSMVQTVKRKFRRTLRRVIAETVTDTREIEEELALLRRCLGI
jgi:RNA polymerase sigma factor (sigma-70 family)